MDQIEGHPIPQDITGFQFRLIGDMTVKQFAYLAAGLALGFIFFSLPLFFLFRILLGILFGLSGVVLAFVPIEGRSADTMLLLFLHALIKPNEFMYKKTDQTQTVTVTPPHVATTIIKKEPEKKEVVFFSSNPPSDITATRDADMIDLPSDIQEPTIENHEKQHEEPQAPKQQPQPEEPKEELLTEEIEQAKNEEKKEEGHPQVTEAHQKVLELEKQLQEMHMQKDSLERQLSHIHATLQQQPQPVFTPTTATIPEKTQHVKNIPDQLKKTTGIPFAPDFPNLIAGVIKDARGNELPNILVEVKDKDNNPVRAFKTNQLGQFISATPLLNGTYTITFEDPKKQQKFDTVEITADGTILAPLEVISGDAREELRKSLFSS